MTEPCLRCGRPGWDVEAKRLIPHVCFKDEAKGAWSVRDEQWLMRALIRHGLEGWSPEDLELAEALVRRWDAPLGADLSADLSADLEWLQEGRRAASLCGADLAEIEAEVREELGGEKRKAKPATKNHIPDVVPPKKAAKKALAKKAAKKALAKKAAKKAAKKTPVKKVAKKKGGKR